MNLTAALRSLSAATDHVPAEAVTWLSENWDTTAPAALQVLARCARDLEGASDADLVTAYFLLHLCAEKRETRAFPLLVSLAKNPAGLDVILGQAQLFVQTSIMVSCFDGNIGAVFAIASSDTTSMDSKYGAFETIAYLAADGRADRAEVEAFLTRFAETAPVDLEAGWEGWAMAIALLGHEELMQRVRANLERPDLVDFLPDPVELENVFEIARHEPDPLTVFQRDSVAQIDNALARLLRTELLITELLGAAGELGDEDEDEAEAEGPVVNPFRAVGRNDPCPCGSGKKYKKCCLAA